MDTTTQDRNHSLLSSRVGRAAIVRVILFDSLRERCGELGVREGDRVVVTGRDGDSLLIRKRAGPELRCPCEIARFVGIE